jgi:hypothetical protein
MMRSNPYKIGSVKINLPDENQGYFSIFEDLAELFGKEYQSDAVKVLRAKLKDVKPKASIDYESDFTHITTANVDTLLSVIKAIVELAPDKLPEFSKIDEPALKDLFDKAKRNRPKPKEWKNGDVFSIPLCDHSFAFGQVLDKRYCTCALFDLKSNEPYMALPQFLKLKPLSILHLSNGDLLNNGQWKILFNEAIKLDPSAGNGGKAGTIGSISHGRCRAMTDLANVYWGLEPWNVMYEEDYYDELLLKNVVRPVTAVVLSQDERTKYRMEKFGIK